MILWLPQLMRCTILWHLQSKGLTICTHTHTLPPPTPPPRLTFSRMPLSLLNYMYVTKYGITYAIWGNLEKSVVTCLNLVPNYQISFPPPHTPITGFSKLLFLLSEGAQKQWPTVCLCPFVSWLSYYSTIGFISPLTLHTKEVTNIMVQPAGANYSMSLYTAKLWIILTSEIWQKTEWVYMTKG